MTARAGLRSLARLITGRILHYYRTPPAPGSFAFVALTFPAWAALTWSFLELSGFFGIRTETYTTRDLVIRLPLYLVMPAILEESIYRPVFFPPGLALRSRAFAARTAVSTAIFVAAHPLNALLFSRDDLPVFADWRFLVAVALLGVYCSVLLVRTRTIWFGIAVHYVLVVAWKFVLCGEHVG